MPKEVKDQYSTVQINSSLGWRLCPWSVGLGIQNRVDMRFGMHRVFMGLRAGRCNSMSSEHSETFTMGHGEDDFVHGVSEVK